MKVQVSLSLVVASLCVSACAGLGGTKGAKNYVSSVENGLNIPHVYIPPNNGFHPYTLLQYTKKEGYQPVCGADLLTGITSSELPKRIQRSDTAQADLKKSFTTSFDVSLGKEEIGNADAKYLNTGRVDLVFANGKQISIPGVHLSDTVQNIKASKCADDIALISSEIAGSEFYVPNIVFGYDVTYKFYDKSGVDISAGMPAALKKIVLSKAGLSNENTIQMDMEGKNLYVGFRGLPLKASIKTLTARGVGSNSQNIVEFDKPLDELDPNQAYTVDVTDIVRNVAMKKQ